MNARIPLALLVLALASSTALAEDGAPPPPVPTPEAVGVIHPPAELPAPDTVASAGLSAKDVAFLNKTAQGASIELKLAQLAKGRVSTESVQQLCATILREHPQNVADLQRVAKAAGLSLDEVNEAREQAVVQRLAKVEEAEFERAFLEEVIAMHRSDVADCEEISASAGAAEVKAFARRTLPSLRDVLAQSQALHHDVVVATR